MVTLIKEFRSSRRAFGAFACKVFGSLLVGISATFVGCGAEPSERELKNRRELEALLTAVVLKDVKEVERDARRIEARRAAGELSDARCSDLKKIVDAARAGDWSVAEKQTYGFRERYPFFN